MKTDVSEVSYRPKLLLAAAFAAAIVVLALLPLYIDLYQIQLLTYGLILDFNELQSLMGGLHGRLRNLESHWRDQEQRKFTEAFESTMKALAIFLEASTQHVSFLGKKASAIEDYLKQK